MPEASPYNSSSLRAYLLAQPAQQETADDTEPPAISDEEVFADDALYLALEQERHDLVVDFVDGRLSARDAAIVREHCLHSPAFEQEVAAHRAMRTALSKQQPRHTEPRFISSSTLVRSGVLRFATNAWMLGTLVAGATAIAVLLFAPWRRPPSAAPSVAQQVQPAATPMRDIPVPTPAQVFFLAEGRTRGDQGVPKIDIRKDTSEVDLELPVRRSAGSASGSESWHLELLEGNAPVWSADDVIPKQIGAQTILLARVPVKSLHPGSFKMRMIRRDAPRQSIERSFVVTGK